tara:strand:+ start:173 stop:1120 length:948 start_codon:yes stop_codon:yes gene_type:complete
MSKQQNTLGATAVYDMVAKINEQEFTATQVDLSKKKFTADVMQGIAGNTLALLQADRNAEGAVTALAKKGADWKHYIPFGSEAMGIKSPHNKASSDLINRIIALALLNDPNSKWGKHPLNPHLVWVHTQTASQALSLNFEKSADGKMTMKTDADPSLKEIFGNEATLESVNKAKRELSGRVSTYRKRLMEKLAKRTEVVTLDDGQVIERVADPEVLAHFDKVRAEKQAEAAQAQAQADKAKAKLEKITLIGDIEIEVKALRDQFHELTNDHEHHAESISGLGKGKIQPIQETFDSLMKLLTPAAKSPYFKRQAKK